MLINAEPKGKGNTMGKGIEVLGRYWPCPCWAQLVGSMLSC